MTHEPEDEFAREVYHDLVDIYGESRVHVEKHLDNSGRVCDLYVETPDDSGDLALEVENDFESAFGGFGQAWLYGHQLSAQRFVIVPPGHVDIPEALYLSASPITVFQWPTES